MISDDMLARLIDWAKFLDNGDLTSALTELAECRGSELLLPKKDRVPILLRIDRSVVLKLDALARDWGETRSGALRTIIETYFESR